MNNDPQQKRTAEFVVSIVLTIIGILLFFYAMFLYTVVLRLMSSPKNNGEALGLITLIAIVPIYLIVAGSSFVPTTISFFVCLYNSIKMKQKWAKIILIINIVVMSILILSVIILFSYNAIRNGASTSTSTSISAN